MARTERDFLTQVREQAERTLTLLTAEIRKREAELEKLLEQARLWRDALTNSITGAVAPARKKKAARRTAAKRKTAKKAARGAKKKTTARKRKSGARVDWDKLLAGLPSTFTIDDIMKTPGGKSKGRNQVYPAINRWVKAKKARKVGTGRYKRIA